ncbi:MAG: acylphosphatase [Candidatus Omnitrophica bacterium]|nr:acylphosphatase [Candidatus Omnitrophota bacterium]
MNKRLHVYYSGSVHGVGFRYTTQGMASRLGLSGWVKNLKDGRVEAMCEGPDAALKEFIRKIDSIFNEYIKDKDIEWLEATGEFDDFDIMF